MAAMTDTAAQIRDLAAAALRAAAPGQVVVRVGDDEYLPTYASGPYPVDCRLVEPSEPAEG